MADKVRYDISLVSEEETLSKAIKLNQNLGSILDDFKKNHDFISVQRIVCPKDYDESFAKDYSKIYVDSRLFTGKDFSMSITSAFKKHNLLWQLDVIYTSEREFQEIDDYLMNLRNEEVFVLKSDNLK